MHIANLYKTKKTVVSLEVFPPRKDQDPEGVLNTIGQLEALRPDFISVTYSAGGSGGTEVTTDIAAVIESRYGIPALAHLTCAGASPEDIDRHLNKLRTAGVQNVMALRGDLPAGGTADGAFLYAKDLIAYIAEREADFCIGAAAYPEGHLTADSMEESLSHARQKVEAGASFLVTQLFFDNDIFRRFYEKARASDIDVPISAGIMPILGRSQIEKMIFMCGASLPAQIIRILTKYENDPEGLVQAGIEYSNRQIRGLMECGADGIHIYTMNRPRIARENIAAIRSKR